MDVAVSRAVTGFDRFGRDFGARGLGEVAGWQLVAGNLGTILPRLVASGVGYGFMPYPPVATLASARMKKSFVVAGGNLSGGAG